MKVKLDENFGTRTQNIFKRFGHDVHSVYEESLSGATDPDIFEVCRKEERCLVTLDLDFTDVIRFPPGQMFGIVVIRLPRNPSLPLLERLVEQFLQYESQNSVIGQLWVVEPGRIRVHQQK